MTREASRTTATIETRLTVGVTAEELAAFEAAAKAANLSVARFIALTTMEALARSHADNGDHVRLDPTNTVVVIKPGLGKEGFGERAILIERVDAVIRATVIGENVAAYPPNAVILPLSAGDVVVQRGGSEEISIRVVGSAGVTVDQDDASAAVADLLDPDHDLE